MKPTASGSVSDSILNSEAQKRPFPLSDTSSSHSPRATAAKQRRMEDEEDIASKRTCQDITVDSQTFPISADSNTSARTSIAGIKSTMRDPYHNSSTTYTRGSQRNASQNARAKISKSSKPRPYKKKKQAANRITVLKVRLPNTDKMNLDTGMYKQRQFLLHSISDYKLMTL